MKILKISLRLLIISLILGVNSSFALGIDHFNVKLSPDSAKVGEAFDVTIEAMDKNGSIVTNYDGTILVFSESDPEAEFPTVLKTNSYTFTQNDSGKVKFENAVSFKNQGIQDLYAYDINDDNIFGYAEVEITKEEIITNKEINIVSPGDGITIGIDHFNVKLSPDSAKVGEAFDVTIEAMDKNGSIVTDYNGTILVFSVSDPKAEFPTVLKTNSYTFTQNDSGKVKFENAVSFRNPGTHDLHVYDINDDTILGYAEVNIIDEEKEILIKEKTKASFYKVKEKLNSYSKTKRIKIYTLLLNELEDIKKLIEYGDKDIMVKQLILLIKKEISIIMK